MRFRLRHLLLFVTLTGVGSWIFTQIGMNTARYEIIQMDVHYDRQWNKYWSRIKWKVHLPKHDAGGLFTSFIEVDKDFQAAGYEAGDVVRFRFRETEFFGRQVENPKKTLIDMLFSVEANILEDNGGDIFAGPYPTVKKVESSGQWE